MLDARDSFSSSYEDGMLSKVQNSSRSNLRGMEYFKFAGYFSLQMIFIYKLQVYVPSLWNI